ncbi:beta-hexosaminidase [Niabella ginsenosidivorans]|uniref:beta-N-acetylhexosaminidase n=2 Tax=Niabella ginsenosidivorans TaxID=1176587 RepID=A0A1A9I823_9BACT|nr:beta-hexosaminidase [Niabella ginsenosidivorans]
MKICLMAVIAGLYLSGAGQEQCPVIPAPVQAVRSAETFLLSRYTGLILDAPELKGAGAYLQQRLLDLKQIPVAVKPADADYIRLSINKQAKQDESYRLAITKKGVNITANSVAGVTNGISSLLQLVSLQKPVNGGVSLEGWSIKDAPRYGWRGFMLDESRHFMGKAKVLQLLDWMAFYKLNRFHWHLTDEPGWRIEIKRYPKLALLGGLGNFTNPTAPAAYYTQEEISEIVHYAAQRNITVIPEIDMPGHATAANRAYPQYSGGGNEQHPDFTFDPGNEGTYGYLMNILREVNLLFPSGMIHLGGDEVSFGSDKWIQHEGVKKLMQTHSLKDLKAVERYFMERMADSVYSLHAGLLAWDEMAAVNLPKDKTIICWWRHDQPRQLQLALDKGYRIIVCPRLPYYFDFVQDSSHRMGRKWGKAYAPIKDVYNYKAESLIADQKQQAQVLGIQANLWTETVTNFNRMDYMVFPRIAALAEAAWTTDALKNYDGFATRLKMQLPLYRDAGIYFYNPFDPSEIPEPVFFRRDTRSLSAQEN